MSTYRILLVLLTIPHVVFPNEEKSNNNFPSNQSVQPIMIVTTHSIKKSSDDNHEDPFSDYIELIKLSSKKMDKFERHKERSKKICYLLGFGIGIELLITSIGRFTGTQHYLEIPISIIKVFCWIGLWEGCKSMIKIIKHEKEIECLQPYIKELSDKLESLKNE